jgi:hypothetical protein
MITDIEREQLEKQLRGGAAAQSASHAKAAGPSRGNAHVRCSIRSRACTTSPLLAAKAVLGNRR